MIYIVLREPTSSGFVNRLAFSDNDAIEVISCGGATIATQKGRLSEIGELANEINISQAQGAVAQGVEGSLAVVDWDGAARVSAEIYAGMKRFYGWSLAVARSDAPTAAPDWLWGDPDHCMVTDISTDGGTIGLTYGERWANDGRLLSFGKDGATVPLVVGGHDVWVQTSTAKASISLTVGRPLSLNGGNPSSPTKLYAQIKNPTSISYLGPSTGGGGVVWFTLSGYEVQETPLSERKAFFDSIMNAKAPFLCGKTSSIPIDKTRVFNPSGDYSVIQIYGAEDFSQTWFFQKETDASSVFIEDRQDSFIICAGGSDILGFSESLKLISGEKKIDSGVLSIRPGFQDASGTRAYSRVPCRIGWVSGTAAGGVSFSGDSTKVITDGKAAGQFSSLDTDLIPTAPVNGIMFFKNSENATAGGVTLNIQIEGEEPSFEKYVSTITAKLVTKFSEVGGGYGGTALYSIPFGAKDQAWHEDRIPNVPREHLFFEDLSKLVSAKEFTSIADINSNGIWGGAVTSVDGQHTWMNFQILAINIYGIDSVSFGSDYALVAVGESPIDGVHATSQGLWQAAAAILAQTPHSTYLTPFLPSFVPAPADSGECMDASKTCVENAETLAKEIWSIFGWLDGGYISPGYDNQSAQGLGEIPQPPTLQIGRFEDVITEPVVEYCDVAGTLTKKAYIANVDQEYDATNSGKFFGGWGPSTQPDTIVIDGITWTSTNFPPPQPGPGKWYQAILSDGLLHFQWIPFTDYGYLLWQRCRAAWKVHHIKRGATFQFRGIYDDSVIGAMWWDAQRNGARRIDWLCLQPRYLTFSVREAKPLCWAGASVYIPGTLAAFAGYDVSDWDQGGGDTLICVKKSYSLTTGKATYTVAIPPVATASDIPIYRDTLDATHAIDRLVDTLDAAAMISKYTDTLEG